ncbi:MAG: hypothetical protein ACREXP_13350 [Steroidobacteraceae bacterium]
MTAVLTPFSDSRRSVTGRALSVRSRMLCFMGVTVAGRSGAGFGKTA